MMEYTEICKPFDSLTVKELYAILKLRSEIFVVEQNCVFLDTDGKDLSCQHLMLYQNKELMAYARIVPAGLSFTEPSIGRIVSSYAARGKGFGRQLVSLAIANCQRLYGNKPIKIGAQLYLKSFYESFGFVVHGEEYLEDDIVHVDMVRPVTS
ncbi:GNAT family N-acetyltransferase [Pedobacter cryoconitis]|uniref:GNAT family N-acetyltransferase n=1 Tax=Pedobacter cryoconitis TaxID=188932 RepID=UPI001802E0FB|nr:GNAT family N-acetyltransferase [Pedobacter cryoconitis]MBB5645618.1 ElaA protein [Pedobacter cryoconitis]